MEDDMAFIWTKEFSVRVKELDDHHQELFSILNTTMENVITANRDTRKISEDLDRLHQYASHHFKVEEDLFREINFPEAAEHIREHDEFRKEIQKIDGLIKNHDDFVGMKLMEFLAAWFTKHILTSDMKYVPYVTK
jgi:hemerythrin-like metal-binding protein